MNDSYVPLAQSGRRPLQPERFLQAIDAGPAACAPTARTAEHCRAALPTWAWGIDDRGGRVR